MVQIIRPASTISSGSWSPIGDSALHEVTDETSQDGDTTRAEGASGAGTFEVKLATASDPASSVDHTIHAWGKGVGSGAGEKIDVFLFEGTTQISQLANNWTPGRGSYAEGVWTILEAEANNIGDYSDLRVRFVEDTIGGGSERFNVTQVYMEIPDASTIYEVDLVLGRGQHTIVPLSTLTRVGVVSLDINNRTVVPISFVDFVGVVQLAKDLNIVLIGNINTPQNISLNKDAGISLLGGMIFAATLALGKDNALALVGVVVPASGSTFEVSLALGKTNALTLLTSLITANAISLGRDTGESMAAFLTRVGEVSLTETFGDVYSSQLDAVGVLLLPIAVTLALNGNVIYPTDFSLTRDLGLTPSAAAEFNAVLSLAKEVTFVTVSEFISGVSHPFIEGNVSLIEQATGSVEVSENNIGSLEFIESANGLLEIIEQAQGSMVVVETATGILILDLTPVD